MLESKANSYKHALMQNSLEAKNEANNDNILKPACHKLPI